MFTFIRAFFKTVKDALENSRKIKQHKCKVISIDQDQDENYIATIQLVNKNQVLKMNPEEILSDDELTDCFSQRDIRTLTYLGYLGINSPKYKILAKRLSVADNRLVFAIKQKGNKKPLIKTADELSSDKEIISSLDQKDAHMLGYTAASERDLIEKQQKKKLLD